MDNKLKEIYYILMGARGYWKGSGKCMGEEVYLEWIATPTNFASAIRYHTNSPEKNIRTKVIKLP